MANAQPAPPPGLRPMKPIQRVPFVEEALPLVGPPLTDPNDHPFASTPPAAAAGAMPAAAAPSFVTGAASTPALAAPAAPVPSFASTLAAAAPSAAALVSAPSAATAMGMAAPALSAIAPALGGAAPALSEIASAAPTAEALLASPSTATALGAAAPALSAAAPNVAQYANPLLQNVAYQDPTLTNADRVAGIGQSHPAEDAQVSGAVKSFAQTAAEKAAASRLAIVPTLEALGVGAAKAIGGGIAGVLIPSTPLNKGEDEAVRQMHASDPAWQEMLRRQKEDPTYSPLHDDPPSSPPPSVAPPTGDPPPGS